MKAPGYTDEQIAYVIDTYPTHTVQQQADHLGRTYSAIRGLRSKLIRAGRINATPLRPWTPADDEQLIELICDGVGMHRIARKLDRTHKAVKTRLEHHGGIAAIRSLLHSPLPILDVARLFGVHHHRVQRWVHWGWLTTKRGRRKHEPRLIPQESIAAFIANPRYWMAWEPKHMTDPDWRAEAERLRAEADGFWVPLNDWTVARGYHNAYASKWVRSGTVYAAHCAVSAARRVAQQEGRVMYVTRLDHVCCLIKQRRPLTAAQRADLERFIRTGPAFADSGAVLLHMRTVERIALRLLADVPVGAGQLELPL